MSESVPQIGDKVWVTKESDDKFKGTVKRIKSSSIVKHGSNKVYYIEPKRGGAELKTRLLHLQWGFSSKKRRYEEAQGEKEEAPSVDVPQGSKQKKKKGKAGGGSKSSSMLAYPPSETAATVVQESDPRLAMPPHRLILAPMVGGSELAFRLLCRKYGADLAYTPMMSSAQFAVDPEYRAREFQTTPEDRPLVAHFSGNDPEVMFAAAKLIEPDCDAIDLNLGCPQRIAHAGHFGSYLLGDQDRPLVLSIVKRLALTPVSEGGLKVPVFVKVRLLDTVAESLQLVEQLCVAGASLITIHARYRVNLVGRSGPGARDGAAKLDQVAVIKEAMATKVQNGKYAHVPIIANGNITCWQDCVDNLKETQADGLMSAEGILDDPALFWGQHAERGKLLGTLAAADDDAAPASTSSPSPSPSSPSPEPPPPPFDLLTRLPPAPPKHHPCFETAEAAASAAAASAAAAGAATATTTAETTATTTTTSVGDRPSRLQLAVEYLELVKRFPVKQSSVVFHTRRMCRDELAAYQMMEDLVTCQSLDEIIKVVAQLVAHKEKGDYVFDPNKEKRAKEAAARKKREEGKRKDYEARMVRKAKREGFADLNHYLNPEAIKPPHVSEVAAVQALGEEKERGGGGEGGGGGGGGGGGPEEGGKQRQLSFWRSRWPQHCFAYHLGGVKGCERDRRCAFLHLDPLPDVAAAGADGGSNNISAIRKPRFDDAPSWLEENGG